MLARIEERYGVNLADLDVRPDAARLVGPVLVLHDADDRVVPFVDGAAIAKLAPRGRLVTTRGLGHNRILRAPEVLDEVLSFLTEGERASAASSLDEELFRRDLRW
jgi:pimeloyl-ACP methyl ester carboxylesterase